jgi:catechol 2,3-dioxygenase-like lactoylglutathione lyase family enzyme
MLHHVELYVSDLARSLAFWEPFLRQLGYHESQRWSEGVSFMFGKTYLCFVQAPSGHLQAGYHRKRVGLNHLAFHGQSRDHVDEVSRWARSAGIAILYDAEYPYAGGPGYYAFYCEDPDRIKVEVVAPED